jgi:hypothetical protein
MLNRNANLYLGHRLTTFPLVHLSLFHFLISVIPLIPLLEKFEEENSTIVTLLLFFGRKSLLQLSLYYKLTRPSSIDDHPSSFIHPSG